MINAYKKLTKRIRDSLSCAIAIMGIISTFLSILGISLRDLIKNNIIIRIIVVVIFLIILFLLFYIILGCLYRDSVDLIINKTPVVIKYGDIFYERGFKVIGCDTHFDDRIDDIVIAKKSLHGQLFLEHGDINDIKCTVEKTAKKLGLKKNELGQYTFPLGTIIRYDSKVDGQTYLMLAMSELDKKYKARTNIAKFESMLMEMWREIDRVYANNDVVLPILGTGILEFDDGPKDRKSLLRCMLCTFNNRRIRLNAHIKVVIHNEKRDISLYEFKAMF